MSTNVISLADARARSGRQADVFDAHARAAHAAEEQSAMLRLVFANAPQLIGVIQREGETFRHLVVNPVVERFLGRRAEEIVGRTCAELGCPAETSRLWISKLDEAERTGLPAMFDYTRLVDGATRLHSAKVTALPRRPDDPHRRFCYVVDDVTDRAKLSEQLSLSERMACVGRLAAGVAHEVNNPLTYVNSNVAFVLEELDNAQALEDPARRSDLKSALSDALHGVERVVKIVRDLQTFVRSGDEVGALVDVPNIAERCLSLTHNETKHRAKVELVPGAAPPVRGNEGQLAQVVVQLIVNAAQAIAQGTPERHHIRVRTGTTPQGGAFIEVEDDGRGMTPEIASRAFEPFFSGHGTSGAIGLGLTVCRNIVEKHHGRISLRSESGAGTTVRVELPSGI